MSFLPKSVALPRSGYSRCIRRCIMLALSSLTSIGALAVPITELYAYRIDPELGRSWVNSITSNDWMTGEDRSNVGYVMRLHQPAQPIPLPPEFINVLGYSINDAGQVTGVGELLVNGKLQTHAFYADTKKGEAFDLPPVAGHQSQGVAINVSGQVAGITEGGGHFFQHAFITDPKGRHLRDLGALDGPSGYSIAAAINSRGEVAGSSRTLDGHIHAFLAGPDGGPLVDLGTPPGGVSSQAYGMNEEGVVVGIWSDTQTFRAFITGPDGAPMSDIGQFDGQPTTPLAVNADGNVVGRVNYGGSSPVLAFVSGDNGVGFKLLNDLTHNVQTKFGVAVAINDLGHIIAQGKDGYSYILCPTPHCK